MTSPGGFAQTRRESVETSRTSPVNRLILFVIPITGILAGAFSIQGVSPHAVVSALAGIAGMAAVVSSRAPISPVARMVLWVSIAWAIVTAIHVVLRGVQIDNEVTITLSGLAILIGVSSMRTSRTALQSFTIGWTFAYMIAVAGALAEKFLGFLPRNNYLVLQGGRSLEVVGLSSFFGNPNGFALFLLATSIVFAPRVISAARPSTRLLYWLLEFSIVYFMIQTNSRTGVTLLLLALIVVVWVVLSGHPVLRVMAALVSVCAIIALSLGVGNVNLSDELQRVSLLSDTTVDDSSFVVRYNLFLSGLDFFGESPIIGIGPSMFQQYMLAGRSTYPTMGIINPHGGTIQLLSEFGIIVFALFIVLLIRLWGRAFRHLRTAPSARTSQFATAISVLMLIAALPFASTMHSTFLADPSAWLFLSAIVVLDRMSDADSKAVESTLVDKADLR